jgi:hypothetical protein
MPIIPVIFFEEVDGSVPFLDWFETLPDKARDTRNSHAAQAQAQAEAHD